jgi:multiple antibiotic resistance protein
MMFNNFLLCFVPFFVAVDAIGVLPIYMGMTEGLDSGRKRRVLIQSVVTAAVVSVAFLLVGPAVLALVGVSVPDFMVAGGILLLVISLTDLITGEKRQRRSGVGDILGAVPIGVPLLSGPAVFTTSILLVNEYGIPLTAAALLINVLIAGILFILSDPIERFLGNAGSKILSKIASLFLASIAVMLIRKGIIEIIQGNLN